jgi:thioredoxin reductase
MIDRKSIAGKYPEITQHAQLLVIGAGPVGIAAAIEGARAGLQVILVDENPTSGALMGLDVPLFYGQRMSGAVQNKDRMVEQMLIASPALEEAFELGVEVLLGTYVWGAFVNGPGVQSLPGRVVGLADEEKSWLCRFDALVLATGARDLVLSFTGIEQPGVMGANAFQALVERYNEFTGKRLVILGSGDLAVATATLALDHGLEVAALVEVRDTPQASVDGLVARGVEILTGQVILEAKTNVEGVSGAVLVDLADGTQRVIDCDTICLAIGLVPNIELADVLGCRIVPSGALGGHVPVLDASGQAVDGVFPVGDCAGLTNAGAAEGQAAAQAAARWIAGKPAIETASAEPQSDAYGYRLDWMQALLKTGSSSVLACLCEEVTREELVGVKPPRYLGCTSNKIALRNAATLLKDGPLNHDQFKRLTRVTMGPCQGRRCREQVALMLAIESEIPVEAVPLAGYRAPVRPLPLSVLAADDETAAMAAGWDVWFGIKGQWTPYADIGTEREAQHDEDDDGDSLHL